MLALVATPACIGHEAPFAPSPVILPDVAVVTAGDTQTCTVQYATVRSFNIHAEQQRDWTVCIRIDSSYRADNSIRVIGERRCEGAVFVSADIGAGHSPLVAIL